MKKQIYITLFAFLGLLFHFLVLELVETWYINYSMKEFSGIVFLSAAGIWLALGTVCGFIEGKFFWQKIYVERVRKEAVFKWFSRKR
jgi:uncharacterized membrane protein